MRRTFGAEALAAQPERLRCAVSDNASHPKQIKVRPLSTHHVTDAGVDPPVLRPVFEIHPMEPVSRPEIEGCPMKAGGHCSRFQSPPRRAAIPWVLRLFLA
jgi:hypothetical protein